MVLKMTTTPPWLTWIDILKTASHQMFLRYVLVTSCPPIQNALDAFTLFSFSHSLSPVGAHYQTTIKYATKRLQIRLKRNTLVESREDASTWQLAVAMSLMVATKTRRVTDWYWCQIGQVKPRKLKAQEARKNESLDSMSRSRSNHMRASSCPLSTVKMAEQNLHNSRIVIKL